MGAAEARRIDPVEPGKGGSVVRHTYGEVRQDLRMGDLLCFRGTGFFSRAIRFLTKSEYSHVGLVFLYESRVYCLEAVPAGLRLILMSRKAKLYDGGIDYFRVHGASEDQRNRAVGFAFQLLGEPYSYSGILRFLRFLISGNKERIRQRDGWFCSEVVAEAYRRQKAPLVERQSAAYTSPADLVKSDKVEFAFKITRDR